MFLLRKLPLKLISRWTGRLVRVRWPWPLRPFLIWGFATIYGIDLSEVERPFSSYDSIGDFFVRRLKPQARPLASTDAVHPADSVVTQARSIADGRLIQAKGKFYSVTDLVGDHELANKMEGGQFLTYYLCPTDYHRVHCPVETEISLLRHIPGHLWPVHQKSVETIENLFAVNERMVIPLHTRKGPAVAVMVGATNVGEIEMVFDPIFRTHQTRVHEVRVKTYAPAINLKKGQEMGVFHMGSTVVLLLSREFCQNAGILSVSSWQGKQVKMGQALT